MVELKVKEIGVHKTIRSFAKFMRENSQYHIINHKGKFVKKLSSCDKEITLAFKWKENKL